MSRGYVSGCLGSVYAPYVGPGDVVPGAIGWWGLRGYTNAKIGTNAIRLRESGGNTERDFEIDASGRLNSAAVATFAGANNLFVVTLYDQVGSYHLTQATAGNQPQFYVNPAVTPDQVILFLASTPTTLDGSGAYTQAQPLTISNFVRNLYIGTQAVLFGNGFLLAAGFNYGGGAAQPWMWTGVAVGSTIAQDGVWHGVQSVYNDDASDINVDGVANAVDLASTTGLATGNLQYGQFATTQYITAFTTEVGIWPSAFSGAESEDISNNQRDYWNLSYEGPGDVVPGAVGWWGLRAYSLAAVGRNAVRLREDGGNTEQDFATIDGGNLNLGAVAAFKGANNLFVVKLYDQVGSNDLVQATAGSQPALTLSGLGLLPIVTFTSSKRMDSASGLTQAQPLTISTVLYHNSSSGENFIARSIDAWLRIDFNGSNVFLMITVGGAGVGAVAADFTWHALQAVFNGTSSDLNVDGTPSIGDAGTLGFAGEAFVCPYNATGSFTETGLWPSVFSSGQSSAMSANQHDAWGF